MIKGFNEEEKMALIAISKFIVNADGRISEEEISKFDQIADKQGFEDFTEIFRKVDDEINNIDDLKKLIKKIKNATHKFDILRYAIEIAMVDANIEPGEIKILGIVGKEWKIDIKSILKGKKK